MMYDFFAERRSSFKSQYHMYASHKYYDPNVKFVPNTKLIIEKMKFKIRLKSSLKSNTITPPFIKKYQPITWRCQASGYRINPTLTMNNLTLCIAIWHKILSANLSNRHEWQSVLSRLSCVALLTILNNDKYILSLISKTCNNKFKIDSHTF